MGSLRTKIGTLIVLILLTLGIVTIAACRARNGLYIEEGMRLRYYLGKYLTIFFINNTHKSTKTEGSWINIKVLKIERGRALVSTSLNFNINGTPYEINGNCYINIHSGDVFLLNGTKIGTTGIWIPLNLLYTGSKIELPKSLGHRAGRVMLVYHLPKKPLEYLGRRIQYGPVYKARFDPTDREAYNIIKIDFAKFYRLVERGITNGSLGKEFIIRTVWDVFDIVRWRAINITRKERRLEFILEILWISSKTGAGFGKYLRIDKPEGYDIGYIGPSPGGGVAGSIYSATTGIALRYRFYNPEPLLVPLGILRLGESGILDPTGSRLPEVTGFERTLYGFGEVIGLILMVPAILKYSIVALSHIDKLLRKRARRIVSILESLRYTHPYRPRE